MIRIILHTQCGCSKVITKGGVFQPKINPPEVYCEPLVDMFGDTQVKDPEERPSCKVRRFRLFQWDTASETAEYYEEIASATTP